MSCNVVLRGVLLYCNDDWHVKDGVEHHSRQQWLVAKWLGLGVNLQLGLGLGLGSGIISAFIFYSSVLK